MLESLAAWVLKYFLGKYVENLNTDQLTIGLLQGEVELENLPLKKEALRQVGLPVQVTSGFIGKVKLQIPFTALRTAPWVIIIEKIYLVAAPVNLAEWDEEAEEQALLEQKLSILDAIEAQWRASTDGLDQGYYASSYTSWMNFGTSVVSNIVESLQLNITDVHIRYEDCLTVDGKYFTFGLLIDSLVAQSCTESWEPGYTTGQLSFKLLELSKLSVYWDDCEFDEFIGNKDAAEFISAMGKQSSRGKRFLLNSVSGKAHLTKNRSTEPLRSRSTPRIICDVMFDDFPISLSDKQYAQIIDWQRGLEVLKCRMAMRRLRPICAVSEDPKKWWKYFLQATLDNSRAIDVGNWDLVLKRARDNVAYVQVYEKILSNPAGALSEEQKNLKDRIETEQSLDELRALRVSAMHRVRPATKPAAPTSTNYLSAWFPQFWYSADSGDQNTVDRDKLNEELFQAIDGPMDEAAYLKRDVVFGQFNFSLKEGSVALSTASEDDPNSLKALFELQLEKVLLGFEWRPRNASFKISVTLGAIFLKDKLTTDSIFPILVAPQGRDVAPSNIDTKRNLPPGLARLVNQNSNRSTDESLFQLLFELKPPDSNADCKIHVKTQSLDIVYNPGALAWLTDFFTKPQYAHGSNLRIAARRRYQAIKNATKNELMKNWGEIIAGKLTNRKIWNIDLDISAPQIIFVEHFCDKNAIIVVVDLGRLHFTNCAQSQSTLNKKDSDEDEAFQTPCSTPPGSQASPENSTPSGLPLSQLNELSLHAMLYERYVVELGEMQVLVGRVRDSWKFAQLKGTSSLHILDRFNISMQIERRVVYTCDPQYPSLTFSGNLPSLVVHVNEQKIASLRSMYAIVMGSSGTTPPSPQELPMEEEQLEERADESRSEASRLIIMQFVVQHLALEVQSRNRSVAELKVSGVQLGCTRRQYDTSVTLTVHSLLLVDALQTFGRDFELLVASHKHVGMDSLSGSLRDSEPCSPTSPGSPEPGEYPASPIAITQALTDLDGLVSPKNSMFVPTSPASVCSPPPGIVIRPLTDLPDSEALIIVELTFISGSCPGHDGQPLQIAALQFNNLDVIANQETIVELLGFARRVFPPTKAQPIRAPPIPTGDLIKKDKESETPSEENTIRTQLPTRTEATFDFHRLNILLLRAAVKDGVSVGRKICTATMMEAKIKASVGEEVVVEGSLGGIQVLDLTPEGARHQRILSLGADPLARNETSFAHLSAGLYGYNSSTIVDDPAFSFCVKRSLQPGLSDCVDIKVRLASVWYTHSPILLRELQSCATEFKNYLTNLARSIRSAATEVAMGIVHARAEALAMSLSMSNRIYGGSNPDVSSPRKRRKSFTQSLENMAQTPFTPYAPHTPWSPEDDEFFDSITFQLDVVLDSPVIVLPQSANSDYVFVAHLGKITLRNSYPEREAPWESRIEKYHIDVRDVNLHSVVAAPLVSNISLSASGDAILPRPEKIYSHGNGKPILHDTVIDLAVERTVTNLAPIAGSWDFNLDGQLDRSQNIQMTGGVVGPLKVSLSREQYQQVIETSEYLLTTWSQPSEMDGNASAKRLGDIEEEETPADKPFTMNLPNRQRLPLTKMNPTSSSSNISFAVVFEVPEFTVELLAELGVPRDGGLVSVSFRDFMLNFERPNSSSSHLQMSLKSLVMEDLLVPEGSKNRFLVVSSAAPTPCNRRFALSQSCPSLSRCPLLVPEHNSLPDNLASTIYFGKQQTGRRKDNPYGLQEADKCAPCTPPPSPRPGRPPAPSMTREENLVLICIDTLDNTETGLERNISVDFNCLDVIANIQSWVVVFDFLGIGEKSKREQSQETRSSIKNEEPIVLRTSKMDLQVRSLTLILVRPEYEVCKANISHLTIKTFSSGHFNLEGRLGSMSLMDLSPHGKLYRERFSTSGKEALHVNYVSYGIRSDHNRPCDSELSIEMSSVIYVHTQRFLNEIYAYFHRFSQLQTFMSAMHSAGNEKNDLKPSSRMRLSISAGSPVLILPVASACTQVLVADLGELTVRNGFRRAGSVGTIAATAPEGTTSVRCLLDVMSVELLNMDLFTGNRISGGSEEDLLKFGALRIRREGPSLLPDKCHLKLQVDRNLDTHLSREVPDIMVQGTLTKLEAFLDLPQYKIIRGLLVYNIGENLQDLAYNVTESTEMLKNNSNEPVWRTLSIHLNLVNVLVHLREKHGEGASLACVNFIKSRLAVDSFSDRAQDIDLVSAEILITDTRYLDEPMNRRYNVFTNILQPLGLKVTPRGHSEKGILEKKASQDSDEGAVQAEIHHRRRKEYAKATILLHNMRLMAVLDWWESARDFITQKLDVPSGFEENRKTHIVDDSSSDVPFEFKLNVTDSEIVLVEDTSAWDTNAIILKSTTVITYRPNMIEKPLSCNLNHCELFSCLLGMEEETALSIIDPVTVNLEVGLRPTVRGIADAVITSADRVLDVSLHALNVRLSYNDFRMLSRMLESVPRQTKKARNNAYQQVEQPANIRNQIAQLSALGFSVEDCAGALEQCNGELDDAAWWLTQNDSRSRPEAPSTVSFNSIEVKLGCLSIVVIDDCRDADVPLLELGLSHFLMKQILNGEGSAKFVFNCDYYNRVLSGWEPFIETWRANLKWENALAANLSRNLLKLDIFSEDLMNINITSTLMDLYKMVKDTWTEDYCDQTPVRAALADEKQVAALNVRRRSPFVPFAIKNETGCPIWYTTLIKTGNNISANIENEENWVLVNPDETVPLMFEGRDKSRHRDTHKVRVHQIVTRVGVWAPVSPVSIDKVGVVFRHASPLSEPMPMNIPPARVVFAISLEGTARKLVTVRSALTLNNTLTEAVEAKLENSFTYPGMWDDTICIQIPPATAVAIPLSHANSNIWIRPFAGENLTRHHAFSSSILGWMKVANAKELIHEMHQCQSNRDKSYRFVAAIYHEDLRESFAGLWMQPAHTISLYSPVVVTNLLPCDLNYSFHQTSVRGHVKPGMSANIHEIDCEQRIEIKLQIDGFPKKGTIMIPPTGASFRGDFRVFDDNDRMLVLNVAVDFYQTAGVRISVLAPFWVVNKTSIPMVVRQQGSSQDAAGQGQETEVARVVSPLLFSLSDSEAGPMAQLRVGNGHLPDSQPQWCQPFPLQIASNVLRLRVALKDRPDVVYIIGINIRNGKGRHRRTKIITLTPRFQLHNKSSFKLQYAQDCLASTLNDPSAATTYGTAVQECSLAWHWPRLDKELLLSVRILDVKNCLWSGGFAIDNDDSFHVNVRDANGKIYFLRAEIVLQGATFFTVFTDADNMPPPVRIDNCALVPIDFYQIGTRSETQRSKVRPQSSMAYAWDLPHGRTKLMVVAPGGSSASFEVHSDSEPNSHLTYENFIYIAFTATFNNVDIQSGSAGFEPLDVESQQLVLDCIDGRKVVLNRKQPGERSQLWCMTSEGQLQHEGSSPPKDPKSKSSRNNATTLVLDIIATAPQPSQCVSLVLRRPDQRRKSTQTWRFTEDGRLCCAHNNMCVQAKDGFFGLRQGSRPGGKWEMWSEAVLGPKSDSTRLGTLPAEQAVSRMKMRPGSGYLVVRIGSDGPTRVLRVCDLKDPKSLDNEWATNIQLDEARPGQGELQVNLKLTSGIGVSVVCRKPPEELLYIHLKGILFNLFQTPAETKLDCRIEKLQADNQLFEPECPVVLYVIQPNREDEPTSPAVTISAHKQHSLNTNAHIFKHLVVSVTNLSLCIEELLLLKLCAMFGPTPDVGIEYAEESDFEMQRRVMEATSALAARYYFGQLKLKPNQIRLSVATSPKLTPQLQKMKKKLGLRLIKFEDATVDLKEFERFHPFETSQCLWGSIVKHFKTELTWRAAAILGTVDFLGNPLGLLNDVSEGVATLIYEGNVGALVKSVTHGLSNSAAKVTESLSDGLGRVILDESHEEARQRIRKVHSGSSRDHLWAGVKGFGFGVLGGVTSVFKQTYDGAAQEGITGILAGFGKGLVGTVTKPMIGILDLASETASALRDSSRTSDRPPRCRLPRMVHGPGGLMPSYSSSQALGQEFLYLVNNGNFAEKLVAFEILLSEVEDLRILISNEQVLLCTSAAVQVAQYHLSTISFSQTVSMEDAATGSTLHFIEIVLHTSAGSGIHTQSPPKKRPRVQCDTRDIAERVCQQINYAQALFEEAQFTVLCYPDLKS